MASSDVILKNPPCFRTGLMWGIGVASVIGAHRFRTIKHIRSSCDWAIGTFLLVSTCSWYHLYLPKPVGFHL